MNAHAGLHVGLVGVDTSHAGAFAEALSQPPLSNLAHLAWVWGDEVRSDQPDAPTLAQRYGIGRVASTPTECLDGTDLALVVSDAGGGARHADLAQPFVEAGIPTFIDKPMTVSLKAASDLFDLAAQRGTPIMSSSALRHAGELSSARASMGELGAISSAISTGPGDWYYYGIHAVELLIAALGPGVTSVRRFATPERDVALLAYGESGPMGIVQTLRNAAYGFELAQYGAGGWLRLAISDSRTYYRNQLIAATTMATSGTPPIAPAETLEILAILHAGLLSADHGGDAITLAEVATGARA